MEEKKKADTAFVKHLYRQCQRERSSALSCPRGGLPGGMQRSRTHTPGAVGHGSEKAAKGTHQGTSSKPGSTGCSPSHPGLRGCAGPGPVPGRALSQHTAQGSTALAPALRAELCQCHPCRDRVGPESCTDGASGDQPGSASGSPRGPSASRSVSNLQEAPALSFPELDLHVMEVTVPPSLYKSKTRFRQGASTIDVNKPYLFVLPFAPRDPTVQITKYHHLERKLSWFTFQQLVCSTSQT